MDHYSIRALENLIIYGCTRYSDKKNWINCEFDIPRILFILTPKIKQNNIVDHERTINALINICDHPASTDRPSNLKIIKININR